MVQEPESISEHLVDTWFIIIDTEWGIEVSYHLQVMKETLTWMLSVSFAMCFMMSLCFSGCICSSFLITTTDSATTNSAQKKEESLVEIRNEIHTFKHHYCSESMCGKYSAFIYQFIHTRNSHCSLHSVYLFNCHDIKTWPRQPAEVKKWAMQWGRKVI